MASRRTLIGLGLLVAGIAVAFVASPWGERWRDASREPSRVVSGSALRVEGEAESEPRPVLRGTSAPEARDMPVAANEGAVDVLVVHGETGAPMPGVRVHAKRTDERFKPLILASATSDAEGRLRLPGVPAYEEWVTILATGSPWVNAEVANGMAELDCRRGWCAPVRRGQAVPFRLRVLPAGRIVGTVHMAGGEPAVGAEVWVRPDRYDHYELPSQPAFPWGCVSPVRVDDSGRFVLDGLPWCERVGLRARLGEGVSGDSAEVGVRPGTSVQVAIVLPGERMARVRVMDSVGGAPIVGADVHMGRRAAQGRDPDQAKGSTDAAGWVALGPLPDEPAVIGVDALGYYGHHAGRAPVPEDEVAGEDAWTLFTAGADGCFEARIALRSAAVLAGRVAVPPTLDPQGFYITVEDVEGKGVPSWPHFPNLDEEGRFALTVPPGSRWVLGVRNRYDYPECAFDVQEVSAGQGDIVVRPSAVAVATASAAGAFWDVDVVGPDGRAPKRAYLDIIWAEHGEYPPLEAYGIWQSAEPSDAADVGPDAARRLCFRVPVNETLGPVWVTVEYAYDDRGQELPLMTRGPLGPEGGALQVRLPTCGVVQGHVLDPDGRPVQSAGVSARALRPAGMGEDLSWSVVLAQALSDREGFFELSTLPPGDVELRVDGGAGTVQPAPAVVRVGTLDAEIRFLGGVDVTVRVEDEGGVPVAGARVAAAQVDGVLGFEGYGMGDDEVSAVTNTAGAATLGPLEASGTYRLTALPPVGRGAELGSTKILRWTPRDTTLGLPAFHPVSGVVRTPAGEPVPGARVWLWCPGEPFARRVEAGADGRFTLRRILAGPLRLLGQLPSLRSHVPPAPPTYEVETGRDDLVVIVDPGRVLRVAIPRLLGGAETPGYLAVTPLGDEQGAVPDLSVPLRKDVDEMFVRGLQAKMRYRIWGGPTSTGLYAEGVVGPEDHVIHLDWRQGATLHGRVRWPPDAYRKRVFIDHEGVLIPYTSRGPTGVFTLQGVPPGTWPVTAQCRVGDEVRRIVEEARIGEPIELDLREPR